ncbi:uncharacterized protein MONOS_15450 [Monocercomonoides exilis]|uniref:uncharacterized protein n=1 Tax=Monocercomonoides exilis TaxID=2049356 RepID=UPI003559B8AE|nr:hypothetical protein MONOS_15450 [Monocercomonoides exilis]|eukprot:MONOS_15450.1-p1 / transcript=MONOS_15450.1 / gene=MONOS_15450 / organism=Monocercomonoides_exilis_PA203 / gene_product=unspecified product / transcript_product=unspecified product / location=Mono_scaffold01236:2118-3574(-) / protein_length=444 / sequence_SO=supercontig / SO=protein_coding / is_pseudo=false
MSLPNDASEDRMQMMTKTEQFSKLFHEQEDCREVEHMQKIEEMNGLIDEMNKEEFKLVFTKEQFNEIHQMIKKEKITLKNSILLLKHVGYSKKLKCFIEFAFNESLLREKIREMIIDENEKKNDEKDEKHLTDLCKCFTLLNDNKIPDELRLIIVPCLLKAASKKEGNEETQKEAEIALLALSHISQFCLLEKELYLNEIKEIIKNHQDHHNLTRLAYQCAWAFLMHRFVDEKKLEDIIVNDLHFAREAAREIEDLSKSVDWKRKEERRKETKVKEVSVIKRWLDVINEFTFSCTLWNEELAGLISSTVQMIRASRDNYPYTSHQSLSLLRCAAEKRKEKIDDLLKSGAIGAVVEEIQQPTINDDLIKNCYYFFSNISERLKEKKYLKVEEAKRKKTKKKVLEKMEEEGFEDIIESLYGYISFVNENDYGEFSRNASEYLMYL